MGLDFRVDIVWALRERVRLAVERELHREWAEGQGYISRQFVRSRTEFDSLEAFCAAGPGEGNDLGCIRRSASDERDAFVARTTEFAGWPEMKRAAAVSDLVAHQTG